MSANQPRIPTPLPVSRKPAKFLLVAVAVAAFMATSAVMYVLLDSAHKPAPPSSVPHKSAQTPAESAAKKVADNAASDTRQRRNAAAAIAMLQNYASDNAGTYPTSAAELQIAIDRYGKMVAGGTLVVYKQSYDTTAAPNTGTIFYYPGYNCAADVPQSAASGRSIAVLYALSSERHGCTDNG